MNFNVDINKVMEQYEIRLSQVTKENIILNVAVGELQKELEALKGDKQKEV